MAYKRKLEAKPLCRKNEKLDSSVQNVDNPEKWNMEMAAPHNIANKTHVIDFLGNFSENSKLQITCTEYETPTSKDQNEALIVRKKR